tara:strand:- start:248 stop:541 length:294 start_codon:yes stop_codon:yes gene_type:complete
MEHAIGASVVIAGFLRGIVPILKSPILGEVWKKWPKWLRPLVLCAIAGLLGMLDAIALGVPFTQSLLSALAAVGVAVTSYESGKGIKLPQKPAELGK